MPKGSVRQFLVTIEGIEGTFANKSGGEKTSSANKVYDGGSLVPDVLAAPPEVGDLTCGRPYDPDRDQDLLNSLIGMVGQFRTTVTVTPTYGDMTRAAAKGRVFSNCLLTGVKEPEVDAGSGDAARLELTFAVGSVS